MKINTQLHKTLSPKIILYINSANNMDILGETGLSDDERKFPEVSPSLPPIL